MAFPAFLDTCVLYGANLNDTLLRIAEEDAFSPQWSPDVVEELCRNLSMIPNLPAGAADRRVKAMTDAFPEAMVEGYEPLIPIMTCDPKDRHVLAAAVHSDSQVLGGFNWSSQHLQCGGGQGWRRWTGAGRPAMCRRGFVDSGVLIGRCARRCVRRAGLSPRVRSSVSSGD